MAQSDCVKAVKAALAEIDEYTAKLRRRSDSERRASAEVCRQIVLKHIGDLING